LVAAKRRLHQIEYFKKLREETESSVSKSDFKKAMGKMHGMLKGVDLNQVLQGFKDEKEHDDGSKMDVITGNKSSRAEKLLKIVLAHLKERPDYYDRLKKAMR
jgi:hypothetical protein